MNIGRYIKKIRKEKGLTQEKLAELTGLCDKTIRRIEKDEYYKETDAIRKIMKFLGIRTSEIKSKDNLVLNYKIDNNSLNDVFKELGYNNSNQIINELEKSISDAYTYIEKEEYREALDIYLAVSKIFKNEKIYLDVANLYYNLREYEEAIKVADIILDKKLYKSEAMNIKGTSLAELKRYNEAIQIFETELSIDESFINYYNLGVIYYLSGNRYKAIDYYKKSLSINSEYPNSHLNISVCYFDTMNYDLSLYHINEVLRLNPDSYQAYGRKGEYYRFFGDYDEAINYFKLCLIADPENYQALLGISISLQMKDKVIESIEYFKRLFKLYAGSIFAKGKETVVIDLAYRKTNIIKFEKINGSIFKVFIKNKCLSINLNDDGSLIYIGGVPISDDKVTILYPTIGKVYRNKREYDKCIDNIKKAINLEQFFDRPIYVEFEKEIKVEITEQEECVLIEISFGDSYKIVSLTDTKGNGFRTFINLFNKYEQFRIQIEQPDDIFIIDCVTNIIINKL
ncbi:tetratricopeptide repeat protein [Clostridium butyricum]|uniref:tetratricopeptide repeat protein n=1 Tax=Clostridium butyricum TaxID=1492 RepID=UPI00374EC380